MAAAGEASNEAFGLNWPYPLFFYPKEGIERLLSNRSVLLADEMGLGKTIQAVAALRILAARREIERALIVCPVGLVAQWHRQIRIGRLSSQCPPPWARWTRGRPPGGRMLRSVLSRERWFVPFRGMIGHDRLVCAPPPGGDDRGPAGLALARRRR